MSHGDNAVACRDVSLHYGQCCALDKLSLSVPTGKMVGLIGPDGVGKSSLLALIAGARKIQDGELQVLGGDMRDSRHRNRICPRIAYMPQGLGKNLYATLSVEENLQFFGRLFDHDADERRRRIDQLTHSTGLYDFLDRPAGKLSGGMKQKLGLCCALIHDPDLLILDEPTTGVDPLARSQFWQLISDIRRRRPAMSVIVATAYMDEARNADTLIAMNQGRILASGSPEQLLAKTGSDSLESAFIALLPEAQRRDYQPVQIPPLNISEQADYAIEASELTMRFGDFVAVDHVNFKIRRGEIFGFLGSNGCGKSTTMKMLTGLLPASEGDAKLFGKAIDPRDLAVRHRVGYMSQSFSLYSELTVMQNLVLHARLFGVDDADIPGRAEEMLERFSLTGVRDSLPGNLPLGLRQRLSLAVALVHKPELLILDEPTSGVDPVARDNFWRLLVSLSRQDGVTIFISTHFMNEAERCDRISLMHAGRVLISDTPTAIQRSRQAESLEAAFIEYLSEASRQRRDSDVDAAPEIADTPRKINPHFSWRRTLSYTRREALELRRDPVRGMLALIGSVFLMIVMGYGISLDVEDLTYAIYDLDQTNLSQSYALNLSGSRYFIERPPIKSYDDMDARLRSGDLALAIEIPPGFARDAKRGDTVTVAAWVDGSMPSRAETVSGYVQGIHQNWLIQIARMQMGMDAQTLATAASVETRFRYNPDVTSLPAMVPAIMPILLLLIPAMLTALSIVREKELGSIINLYVPPVRRSEFLLGKQLPYIALSMLNFLLMTALATTLFDVPVKGSFLALSIAALLFSVCATGMGLVASAVTRSQIAAMFFTMLATLMPAVQFAGLLNPVASLEGPGRVVGELQPVSYFLTISRAIFSKGLDLPQIQGSLWPIILAIPVIMGMALLLLKKQER